MDEKLELIKTYNLTVEQLNFKIDEFSLEDLETKLKEFTATLDNSQDNDSQTNLSFSATYNQKRDALRNALDAIYVRDENGNIIESTYFYLMDFNDEFVFVEKDYWDEAGNFEETHGRYAYTFNEQDLTATLSGEWEEMFLMWLTSAEKTNLDLEREQYTQIKSEFDDYKEKYSVPNEEVEELKTFQANSLEQQRLDAEQEIFTKFDEQLNENEEFKTLKTNSKDFSLEELEDKCFSILGRKTATFSLETPAIKENIKITIDQTSSKTDPYGGLFELYGSKEN